MQPRQPQAGWPSSGAAAGALSMSRGGSTGGTGPPQAQPQQQLQQQLQQQAAQPQQQQQQPPLSAPAAGPVTTPGLAAGAPGLASRYDVLAKIGEGTYGLVYLALARDGSRRLYAIKTFKTGRVRGAAALLGCVLGGHSCVRQPRRGGCLLFVAVPRQDLEQAASPNAPLIARATPPSPLPQEGDGISPTAIREIGLLRELDHPNIVALREVHISRAEASISLAFDYAEHDLYEMIWHHRDRLQGGWGGGARSGGGGGPTERHSLGGAACHCQGSHRLQLPEPTVLPLPLPSRSPAPMDPYTVKSVLWQLLNGLSFMHQNWVIHRDLKVRGGGGLGGWRGSVIQGCTALVA